VFLDPDMRIKRFTPSAIRLFNLINTDVGRPISDIAQKFIDPNLVQDARQVLSSLMPSEKEVGASDGRWFLRRVVPYRTVDNRIEGVVITFTEVTLLKRAAEDMRLLATMLIHSNDAIIVHDFDGQITVWNRAAERMYGYTQAEAMRMNIDVLVLEDERVQSRALRERLRVGEAVDAWETRRRRKDGSTVEVLVTAIAVKGEDGRPKAITSTARDISQRKAAEQALRRSEEAARQQLQEIESIYATAPIGLAYLSTDLRFVRINQYLANMNGLPIEGHLGRTPREILPHLADSIEEILHRVIATKSPALEIEVLFGAPAQPNVVRDWMFSFYPLLEPDGQLRGVSAVVMDITEQKQMEQEILALNTKLEQRITERTAELENTNQVLHAEIAVRKLLEKQVIEIAAEEQRRIGQDLHDSVGQELTGLALTAESLAESLTQHSHADAPLATKIAGGARRVIGEVRALSRWLIPVDVNAPGLAHALEELTARIREQFEVDCTFRGDHVSFSGDSVAATHLYRIAQEAVTNALKHGRAQHIDISLNSVDGKSVLRVANDGVAPQNFENSQGMGLRIMRYRAGLINASLTMDPADHGGMVVTCTVNEDSSHGQEPQGATKQKGTDSDRG
jgi:PAS domain S-box-containing protein